MKTRMIMGCVALAATFAFGETGRIRADDDWQFRLNGGDPYEPGVLECEGVVLRTAGAVDRTRKMCRAQAVRLNPAPTGVELCSKLWYNS